MMMGIGVLGCAWDGSCGLGWCHGVCMACKIHSTLCLAYQLLERGCMLSKFRFLFGVVSWLSFVISFCRDKLRGYGGVHVCYELVKLV